METVEEVVGLAVSMGFLSDSSSPFGTRGGGEGRRGWRRLGGRAERYANDEADDGTGGECSFDIAGCMVAEKTGRGRWDGDYVDA